MRNVIFLFKSIPLPNKFTVPDTRIENKDSVLKKTSISLSIRDDLAPLMITATLLFKKAKLFPGGKKTWLSARPEILEAKKG